MYHIDMKSSSLRTPVSLRETIKKSIKQYNIKSELEKIYRERKRWNGGKGPFNSSEIKCRELILLKQTILERMMDI